MARIDKVQFSSDSGFDLEAAMELSNLIAVAYDDYEVWDEPGLFHSRFRLRT